ncbi:MAG: CTP synthase [Bacteroidota bacterium]|nr:CTP synthase [Bacteroidota bacterium]
MNLAIIGDYNSQYRPHKATNEAIDHSVGKCGIPLRCDWIPTAAIEADFEKIISTYHGYWIAPGSPYKSMSSALQIIRHARENKIPTLGTCGGFQHMVIEFARNVMGIADAEHAEYDPYASKLVVSPLSCSLVGQTLEVELTDPASRTFEIFGDGNIIEKYYCNFGLDSGYQNQLHQKGFKMVGTDKFREARILELENHPFFIATLFVPQDNSTRESPHKLVTGFLQTIARYARLTRIWPVHSL